MDDPALYDPELYRDPYMSGLNTDHCVLNAEGILECEMEGETLWVRNVYPPVQDMAPKVIFVVIVFFVCFIVGICGNISVLTIIRKFVNDSSRVALRRRSTGDNAFLYLSALCVCDFCISLSLPPAIMDSVVGFWMFGTGICKLHHICGSVGRVLSTFIVTAMSFDRFVAVCYPHQSQWRSRKFIVTTLIVLTTLALFLLMPMLMYAQAKEMVLHELRAQNSPNITRVRVYKCSDMMPREVFLYFTVSTFLCGYVIPLFLIVTFNFKLVSKLFKHTRVLTKTTIPLRRVCVFTVMIAVSYFVCWTPYWCSVLYAVYMTFLGENSDTTTNHVVLFLIYCVHIMPYIGSASNWILYGMLNRTLQMKNEGGHSTCNDEHNMSVVTLVHQQAQDKGRLVHRANGVSSLVTNGSGNKVAGSTAVNRSTPIGSMRQSSTDVSMQLNFIEETDQTHL